MKLLSFITLHSALVNEQEVCTFGPGRGLFANTLSVLINSQEIARDGKSRDTSQ